MPLDDLKSSVFLALPVTRQSIKSKPLVTAGEIVEVNVRMSPSSTCRPGQVVSRSPLAPQLAGVPPQLPEAETVMVWAAVGAEASAVKARTRTASAERRRAALPPEVREWRLPRHI